MALRRHGFRVLSLVAIVSVLVSASAVSSSAATAKRTSLPLHVDVLSVDFSSTLDGWILGTGPCGPRAQCLLLERTTNGAASWTRAALPAPLRSNADVQIRMGDYFAGATGGLSVRFENRRDGWIFGSMTGRVLSPGVTNEVVNPVVWSTHNGGVSWRQTTPPDLGGASKYFDLESSATRVNVLGVVATTGRAVVDTSPVNSDHWTRSSLAPLFLPAGGGSASGAITLSGTRGWLTEGNDRGASGSARLNARGQWVSWAGPCASVGGTLAVPEASSPAHLTVACQLGGFGDTSVVGGPPGGNAQSTWLRTSTNGGASFEWGPEIGTTYANSAAVLAAPSTSNVFATLFHFPNSLSASFDRGTHWSRVFPGDIVSLDFLTPSFGFGFGFVGGSTRHAVAIETVDGGHVWTTIAD